MTSIRGAPGAARAPTPVRGERAPLARTTGVARREEVDAAARVQSQVDARDLDLFLQARAGQPQRGLLPSLKRLLGAQRPDAQRTATADAMRASIGEAVRTLGTIYADGLVTEREITALHGARDRMRAVLDLATPDVLNMLPRGARERLQESLFQPLAVLDAAAQRRSDRVLQSVAARDEAALVERLRDPRPTYRLFSASEQARAGRPLVTAERFETGDLVVVPRSDGRTSLGVVVDKDERGQLRVEVMGENGRLALKTLAGDVLLRHNPLKIGDYLEHDGKQIWISGLGRDGRLEGSVKDQTGVHRVDGAKLDEILADVVIHHQLASRLEQLPGMRALPRVTQRLARFALEVGPSDQVFGRLSRALVDALHDPRSLGPTPQAQAVALTRLLRESPDLLHGVVPNFRTEREPAFVATDRSTPSAAPHALFVGDDLAKRTGSIEHEVRFTHGPATYTVKIVEPLPRPAAPAGLRHATLEEVIYNLAKLPPNLLARVKNVVVNPENDPSDAFWQQQFGNPNHRAYMSTRGDGTIHLFPALGFAMSELSLAHEVGHLVSTEAYGGPRAATPGWQAWEQAMRKDNLSVSRYAKNNLSEDFSETFSIYTMTKDTPAHARYRGLMPERFALLDALSAQGYA